MTLQSQIAFNNGSINKDSTLQYVRTDQGQVRDRVNLRLSSKDGEGKANEKILGNLLINTDVPKTGTNKIIGWCNDYKNNGIIYFLYNSISRHCIYRYNINEKNITKIFYDEPALGFEDTIIRACVVENMLYWINGDQEPKSFTIDKAINFTAGLTDNAYIKPDDYPFDQYVFPLIKKPPRFAPECEYYTDSTVNFNNLRKKLFQFKYCYEYSDYQRSAWSPISKVPLPINELWANGEWFTDITINNYISVKIDTGSNQVRKIIIAATESTPLNTLSFFQFEELEKFNKEGEQVIDNDQEYTVNFYNNIRTASVDTDINNRYCDIVPLAARDILLLDNKYLAMSYPLQGYDGIEPDYTLEYEEEEVDVESPSVINMVTKIEEKCVKWLIIGFVEICMLKCKVNTIYIPEHFYENAIYNISFKYKTKIYNHSIVMPPTEPANYPTSIRDEFLNDIRSETDYQFVDNVIGAPYNGIQFEINDGYCFDPDVIENLSGTVTLETDTVQPVFKSLKRGQFHPFGIIYNDNFGRYNIVFGNEGIYSPLVGSGVDDRNKRVICNWEINHAPPDWATTYRWCYIRKKTYTYFLYVPHVKSTLGDGTEGTDNGIPAGKYFLEINQALDGIRELFPNFAISNYIWQNGDRLRFVGSEDSYEILKEWIIVSDTEGVEDTIGFLIDEDLTDDDDHISLIEIYRQNTDPEDNIYLEIGEEFEIDTAYIGTTSYRYHKGQTQDQSFDINGDLVNSAIGTFDFGDIYFRFRFGDNGNTYPVEDENYSDYYVSNSIDVGRAGVKIKSEQKWLNRVIRSENFLENTEYNLLNVFMPDSDYFDASDIWGKIIGIRLVGDVLKIIQEHKETSVYIGKVIAKEGDGSDIVLDSTRVFGTVNNYIEFRGSKYQNSIISNLRHLYYFDESTGEFIRSSANGQLAISSYYWMKSWFENKAKELRESTESKDVIVACDNDYNEVIISFIIGNEIESLVFSEEEENNGWRYFVTYKNDDYIPELFAFQGDTLISFMNGKLYLHNVGINNTFYGKLHGCSVDLIYNLPGYVSKRFDNIRIGSNKNIWDIEFNIDEMFNYTRQKSLLKPSIIREKDGRIQSTILKNIIARDGSENLQLLYNNHDMVGEILQVKLSNNDNEDVILKEVEVKFQLNK